MTARIDVMTKCVYMVRHVGLMLLLGASVAACVVDHSCPKGTFEDSTGRCSHVPTGTTGDEAMRSDSVSPPPDMDAAPQTGEVVQPDGSVDEPPREPPDAGALDAGGKEKDKRNTKDGGSAAPAKVCTSVDETCDNVDNDCDGKIDEGLRKDCDSSSTSQCPHHSMCAAGVWGSCTLSVEAHKEICDGVADDDCDGVPDAQDPDCAKEDHRVFREVSTSGCATSLGVGASGNAWIAGCGGPEQLGNNSLYRLQGDTWSKITGAGIQLAVSPEGNAWVVNNKGEVYRWNQTEFARAPEMCATWVGVGANDDAWIVGCGGTEAANNNSIYRLSGDAWVKQPGAGMQIAVSPEGNAWVLNNKGEVYKWNGTAFEATPMQCATSVGVGRDGAAWIVGCSANGPNGNLIYQLKGDAWTVLAGEDAATQIAVAPEGISWIINAQGKVLRYSPKATP